MAQAGGLSTDNSVRVELDREVSGITYKQRSFADRILFWRADDEETAEGVATDNATGGVPVVIEQSSDAPRNKLPGT